VTFEQLLSLDLPGVARLSVAEALARDELPPPTLVPPPGSGPLAATFVTIQKDEKLRGCMGTTVARRTLLDDVRSQARAAAFRDPRFPAVAADELPELTFEVSVLTPPRDLQVSSFENACELIRPGKDGVIVRTDVGGALFLPQVWETLERPERFLQQLWKKAGLPERYFEPDVAMQTFSVQKFLESA
jgi:hypothetical protein